MNNRRAMANNIRSQNARRAGKKSAGIPLESKILRCTCAHAGQDKLHGKGMRVFNKLGGKDKHDTYRCTVCGTTTTSKG